MNKPDFIIEKGVEMDVGKMKIGKGTVIKKGCRIRCQTLHIGNDVIIGNEVNISSFRGQRADNVIIGDNCYIGKEVNFALPHLEIGDFVTVHKYTGIFGEKPCVIGHNTWVGERAILNTHGFLYIGNNVGIGAGSHTWTHIAQGELLEGCLLFNARPVILEDDTWLVDGQITISPGVIIREKSVILPGTVVSKNTLVAHCYGGVPAKDITDKVPVFKELSLFDKFVMMAKFMAEFIDAQKAQGRRVSRLNDGAYCIKGLGEFYLCKIYNGHNSSSRGIESVIVCIENKTTKPPARTSIFELKNKRYTKNRTPAEIEFIKFMRGYRARFVPANQPRIGTALLKRYCPDYPAAKPE